VGQGAVEGAQERGSDEEDDGEDFDPGEVEKRLYVQEPEFGSMLTVMAREGNSLSSVIRNAWDDRPLRSMVKKDPLQSTNSHVTIVGHVTKEELLKHLTESKLGYGIANRFLFMMVSRSKQLPYGGEQNLFTKAFIKRLKAAIKFAKTHRRVDFCKEPEEEYDGISAYDYWGDVYGELSEDRQFLLGSIISRAESQVRRIATLYAVLDKSEVVRMAHLEAALAVWAYAEDSANLLFGDKTGYRQVDDVLRVIRAHGGDGCRKTKIHETLGNNVLVRRIDQILEDLEKAGGIYREREDGEGKRGGRAELWFPVTG